MFEYILKPKQMHHNCPNLGLICTNILDTQSVIFEFDTIASLYPLHMIVVHYIAQN